MPWRPWPSSSLRPRERVTDDQTETVPLSALAVGDIVLGAPGRSGASQRVDLSAGGRTSTSRCSRGNRSRLPRPGRESGAGPSRQKACESVSPSGRATSRVSCGWSRSAQASKSRPRRWRIVPRPPVLVALAAGAITWPCGGRRRSRRRTDADGNGAGTIACPHALGLVIPLVVAISTALGARERAVGQGPNRT